MTEREKVLLRREGAAKALDRYMPAHEWNASVIKQRADRLFPMPKVTRLRTLAIEGAVYRSSALHGLEYQTADGVWLSAVFVSASLIPALADLMANPTEEVEDEDA